MTNGKKLEGGFYGIKILDACVYLNKNRTGRHIKIAYDILSPEPFRDFFDSDYMHQQKEDQKWNGYIYLPIPYPGKKYNSSSVKKKFEEFVHALENSNPEYKYDRQVKSMIGLRLGAYIEIQPHEYSNGFTYGYKRVAKYCSWDEYEAKRCDKLPILETDKEE